MSKVITGLIILLAAVLIIFFVAHIYSKSALKDVAIAKLDTEKLTDGTYSGEATLKPVIARVSVTVKDGKIADVQVIEHQTGLGKKAEAITAEIIAKQSLEVDAISGATMSSQAILKACEDALTE